MASVPSPTQDQIKLGRLLGLDLEGDSWNVAAARILDIVGLAIGDVPKYAQPTPKQIAYARHLGIDIASEAFRVGFAKIADALLQRNLEALEKLQLKPGDEVIRRREHTTLQGETVTIEEAYVVSSVKLDGRVFFKGGQGRQSYATQLRKLDKDAEFIAGSYERLRRWDFRRGLK